MHINWRLQRVFFGQVFLFILFFWYFTHNSFLRPVADTGTECFIGLMLIVALAINYWVLYPISRNYKGKHLYVLLSTLEIMALAAIEYYLTVDIKILMIPEELLAANGKSIKWTFFMNLVFRNGGLIIFIGLLAHATDLKIRLFENDKRLLRLKHQLIVQSPANGSCSYLLDVGSICFIQQKQNYNKITTVEGQKYDRRGSLKDIQELLGENNYIKISKNTIVRLSRIKSCTDNQVGLLMDNQVEPLWLPIGAVYQSEVMSIIEESRPVPEKSQTVEQQLVAPLPKISSKSKTVYQYIENHPNCKLNDVVEGTKYPKSTITRHLKQLQSQNLIEYVGNKRTGGYRAVGS